MDFIHEQNRFTAQPAQALGVGHHGFDFFDSRQNRTEGQKLAARHTGDNTREGSLAHPGRAPQDDGGQLIAFNLGAQRFARTQHMFLSGEVVERFRPQPVRQGTLFLSGTRSRERTGVEQAHAGAPA